MKSISIKLQEPLFYNKWKESITKVAILSDYQFILKYNKCFKFKLN